MKGDPGTNFTVAEGLSALSRAANTYTSATVDHALAPAATFFISCGTFATSFVSTLTHSADDSSYTAEADTTYGNEVSLTLTEAGSGDVKCPNPRRRYTQISTVIGGTCVFSVTNISGPLRSVDQG